MNKRTVVQTSRTSPTPYQLRWRAISFLKGRNPVIKNQSQQVTQPDEAKPLQRMLEMMASGIPIPERQGNVYGDENPDFFKMDSAEIKMAMHESDDKIAALKEQRSQIARALAQVKETERKAKSSKANASPVGDAEAASAQASEGGKKP